MQHLPGILPIYSAVEMRTIDRITVDEIGIPSAVLMERAGLGAAQQIVRIFPSVRSVAIVCGSGNNGGDGFVVARHLAAAGLEVKVLLVEAESKIRRDSKVYLNVLHKLGISVERVNVTAWSKQFVEIDLVVDAMLGTGVSGAPKPSYEAAIRAIDISGVPVVSLDMPSGVDASTGSVEGCAVRADLTVTFHAPKIGLTIAPGRFHAGRVAVIEIGIPDQVSEPTGQGMVTEELLSVVPNRRREGTKYDASVLVVGGSSSMSGAVHLATRAASRSGAGIVWGAVPDRIASELDVAIPEVQFRGMLCDEEGRLTVAAAERLELLVSSAGSVVFGPGIGNGDQIRALSRWAIQKAPALVLDAQGITAFSDDASAIAARDGAPTLLTPHEGELARLLGVSAEEVRNNRLKYALDAALRTQATVLLKGEDTIIALPGGDFLVCSSHIGQSTAGSGDVLAGVAGALMARGLDPVLSASCAALGCAGAAKLASEELHEDGVIASDIIDYLPQALHPRSDI